MNMSAYTCAKDPKDASNERKFRIALTFLFFELSEIPIPLFPPPGHAGSDGDGPSSVWALNIEL